VRVFDNVGKRSGGRSLWTTLFDSEWQQRADIDDLEARASSMSRRLTTAQGTLEGRVKELEQRVAELALVNRTLLAVLVESGAVTQRLFEDQLLAFDLEDGQADGR
jgi:hypothetical protein